MQLKIKRYQKVLANYVTQLAEEYNNSLGSSKTYQAVTDMVNNRFLLMNVGWYKGKFRYHVLFHLEIHPETGNIWVQQNYTEILLDISNFSCKEYTLETVKKSELCEMRKSYSQKQSEINYDKLVKELGLDFGQIVDHRAPNVVYKLRDILMSGYAMFHLKYSSLLSFEEQSETERQNLSLLYGIERISSDAQFRRILDDVNPSDLQSLFPKRFEQLDSIGKLRDYRFLKKYMLVSIDGVHYFESKCVSCKHCCTRHHRDGTVSYHHSMLGATLIHPDQKEVFSLGGQAIEKQDGNSKNDCELNASKRLQTQLYKDYEGQPFIIVEDALYANGPHIKQIQSNGWDFVLNVKPGSHSALFKHFEARKKRGQVKTQVIEEQTNKGEVKHSFYWMNNVPLNESAGVRVNFLYYEEQLPNGKIKVFSWITSLYLRTSRVWDIMRAGRARWKIENEQFNTLKNQGYHFEHNYGHGYNHLSYVLALLMLLAFLIDQMVQSMDKQFQKVATLVKAKTRLWEKMRAIYFSHLVHSFEQLFLKIELAFVPKIE